MHWSLGQRSGWHCRSTLLLVSRQQKKTSPKKVFFPRKSKIRGTVTHCFAYSYMPYSHCVRAVSETTVLCESPHPPHHQPTPPNLHPLAAVLTGPGPGVDVSAIVSAFVRLRTRRLTCWRGPPVHLHTRLSVPLVIVLFLTVKRREVQKIQKKEKKKGKMDLTG